MLIRLTPSCMTHASQPGQFRLRTCITSGIASGLSAFLLIGSVGVALVPVSAQARTIKDVTVTATAARITRAEFVRQAVLAFGMPLSTRKDLTVRGISSDLLPYLQTAQDVGALDAIGGTANLSAAITRGQAVLFVVQLRKLTDSSATQRSFTDVDQTSDTGKAIAIALSRNWLQPAGSDTFGVQMALSKKDALQLLKNASAKPVAAPTRTIPTITISLPGSTGSKTGSVKQILPHQDTLEQVWQILNNDYYYHDKVDEDQAAYKAAEALAESVKDPYTVFMPPSSAKNFESQLNGEVTGIGATVEQRKDAGGHSVLTVVAPLRSSPAEKAGIQGGDEILQADGVSLNDLPLQDAVDKIRGLKGTTVKLHLRRNGVEFDLDVVRDLVRIPEIDVSYNDNVAVIQLMQFGQITDDNFRTMMQAVALKNPTGIVLDLRNNPGGFLHTAGVVMGTFMPKGSTYAIVKTNDGAEETEKTEMDPIFPTTLPMVVLINKGSASASEIVAGALQDYKRATLVGEKSFGKGSVQRTFNFDDGSTLKVTIAKWFTPLNRGIDGQGIDPDVGVTQDNTGRDDTLLKGLQLVR